MLGDDVARLYGYLGLPSQNYLDFPTENSFMERLERIIRQRSRAGVERKVSHASLPLRKGKIISVISLDKLPGRELVASLAWAAVQRLKGVNSVHVVDLTPTENQDKKKSCYGSNGITHALVDLSQQAAQLRLARETAWLPRQFAGGSDKSVIVFVDVPVRLMHVWHHVMASSDMVLVMLPATAGVMRLIEDIESRLGESRSIAIEGGVHYLLAEPADSERLSRRLMKELVSRAGLFVPGVMQVKSIPTIEQLSGGSKSDFAGLRDLLKVCSFILGKISHESK